jgi:hypothetical protein
MVGGASSQQKDASKHYLNWTFHASAIKVCYNRTMPVLCSFKQIGVAGCAGGITQTATAPAGIQWRFLAV